MKKFISLIVALAVSASAFISFATIASAATDPRVVVEVTELTSEDFEDNPYLDYADDYDWSERGSQYKTYDVAVSITGVEAAITKNQSTSPTTYPGTSITAATVTFAPTTTSAVYGYSGTWYSTIFGNTTFSAGLPSSDGTALGFVGTGTSALVPQKNRAGSITSSDETLIYHALIVLDTTKPVTYTLANASVTIGTFTDAKTQSSPNVGGAVEYTSEGNTFSLYDVDDEDIVSFTLGSAPSPVAVTSVTLDKASTTLTVGGATETLTATVAPNNATNQNVTWSSSNTAVATVGATTGVVTAVSAGNAVITATTEDGGFTATCNVTVNAAGPLLPADILRKDNATPVRKFSAGATLPTLKKDESATLTEDYYATEFETEALDFANYTYAVVAYEEGSEEPHQFEAIGGDLAELLGNIKFFVVIQKQTNPMKPITDIRVKAISAK